MFSFTTDFFSIRIFLIPFFLLLIFFSFARMCRAPGDVSCGTLALLGVLAFIGPGYFLYINHRLPDTNICQCNIMAHYYECNTNDTLPAAHALFCNTTTPVFLYSCDNTNPQLESYDCNAAQQRIGTILLVVGTVLFVVLLLGVLVIIGLDKWYGARRLPPAFDVPQPVVLRSPRDGSPVSCNVCLTPTGGLDCPNPQCHYHVCNACTQIIRGAYTQRCPHCSTSYATFAPPSSSLASSSPPSSSTPA